MSTAVYSQTAFVRNEAQSLTLSKSIMQGWSSSLVASRCAAVFGREPAVPEKWRLGRPKVTRLLAGGCSQLKSNLKMPNRWDREYPQTGCGWASKVTSTYSGWKTMGQNERTEWQGKKEFKKKKKIIIICLSLPLWGNLKPESTEES